MTPINSKSNFTFNLNKNVGYFKASVNKLIVDFSQLKYANHKEIIFQFLPFYHWPDEGIQWRKEKIFTSRKIQEHRSIMFQFLPFWNVEKGREPVRINIVMANKNVKTSRTFENLPDKFVKLPPKELMEEIVQIANGNYKPDWYEYLVKKTDSSPNIDIMNTEKNRTYSSEEINRIKRMFHDPKDIERGKVEEILKMSRSIQGDIDTPNMELGELSDKKFNYEDDLRANQHDDMNNFEDVVKGELMFQLNQGGYFKVGVATFDTGANLNLCNLTALERIGGQMADIDRSVTASIRNSSTEMADEVLGVVDLNLMAFSRRKQQIIDLGAHQFFVINTGMQDLLIGTKSLRQMRYHMKYEPDLEISIKGKTVNEDTERMIITPYNAILKLSNMERLNVEEPGEILIKMLIERSSYQPEIIEEYHKDWTIPKQMLPQLSQGKWATFTYKDTLVEWDMRIRFHHPGLWEPGDINLECHGQSRELTGVSMMTQASETFFGHEVLDQEVDEMASSSISTTELKDSAKIDLSHLEKKTQSILRKIIDNHDEIFTRDGAMVGCFKLKEFGLTFNGTFKSANYPLKLSPTQQHCLEHEVQELLKNGIIESIEDDNEPLLHIFAVGKNKNKLSIASKLEKEGPIDYASWRLVLDARPINRITAGNGYLELPRSEEVISRISNSFVSIVDVKGAYWSIRMQPETASRFRFRCAAKLYCFRRAVMGAKMSALWLAEALGMALSQKMFNKFLRMKNQDTKMIIQEHLLIYCDDLAIFTDNLEDHFLVLEFVFWAFKETGFRVQQNKMVILADKFKILGITYNKIEGKGNRYAFSMKENRVGELQNLPFPTSPRALGSRLSVFSYYNNVLPFFKVLAAPLYILLREKKEVPKVLPLHVRSWQMCLLLVAINTQLRTPSNEYPIIILSDASICSSSGIMAQLIPDENNEDELIVTGVTSKMFSEFVQTGGYI